MAGRIFILLSGCPGKVFNVLSIFAYGRNRPYQGKIFSAVFFKEKPFLISRKQAAEEKSAFLLFGFGNIFENFRCGNRSFPVENYPEYGSYQRSYIK